MAIKMSKEQSKKKAAEEVTEEPETSESNEEKAEAAQTAEEKLTEEIKEVKDSLLRIMAEYDNFRKRSQKEKEAVYGDSKASVIAEFLPLYDNFGRAESQEITDLDSYKKGIDMIYSQFGEILKKLGVEEFGETGDKFDPNIHNAVMHAEDSEMPDSTVQEVFSKGYKLGDRIVRPAIVKVVN